ncbi:hypothetical protein H8356DRAFT_1416685 [Neocallimastix lanati (nom. inval.)]|nr:hypothetical protein H8356DRAFT_1438136 [Neocallimastix sp. JGI-2020a]KAG4083703.1 hypothetical protein H8356DRAFT_1436730 [Neocallimastix sp. JGI-2020a]KAG4107236.1 hypothetical protein H8356DRAFT_1416685 [Neocallimastix sp. JGI-2020a]
MGFLNGVPKRSSREWDSLTGSRKWDSLTGSRKWDSLTGFQKDVFSDSNKLTLFITKVFGYRPGNNSSTFNVSTHEGAGTFQALANKELTSPKANWASGL